MDVILLIIIIFITSDFALRLLLKLLNRSYLHKQPAEVVSDIYDAEKYEKSQLYEREKTNVSLIASSIGFVVLIAMLWFQGFAWFDSLAANISTNPIIKGLLFFGILGLLSDFISLPFDLYNTFVIEERFGFNLTTIRTYIADKIKSWLLALLIGGIALALLIGTWEMIGFWFWIPAWLLMSMIILALSGYGSHIIARIFNKLLPLEEGELKDKIFAFAAKVEFPVKDIYVMDGSRRSNKANAYFSGFGKQKRIVLFDTLMQKLSIDEVVAVLAHESGHYKRGHIHRLLFISIVQTGVMLLLLALALTMPELSASFGVGYHSFHIGLLAFVLLYTPVSFVMGIVGNVISRRFEFEADAFTAKAGHGYELISGLKKLSAENLSNLSPHPAYVFYNYSHPDLATRLNHLNSIVVS
jgi:STE24 endopeptidase